MLIRDKFFFVENFDNVVSGPHYVMWRDTSIKTENQIEPGISQSFSTMEGKVKVNICYRDQPKTCFQCGSPDHKRKDLIRENICENDG